MTAINYLRISLLTFAVSQIVFPIYAVAGTKDTDEASEYYEQAIGYYKNNEYRKATIQLKNALKYNPDFIAAHVLLGRIFLKEGHHAAAEQFLRKANKLGADHALTALPLAQAYLNLHKPNVVLKEIHYKSFQSTLRAKMLVLRGRAYLQKGLIREASGSFNEAAASDPGLPSPIIGQATILLRQEKLDQAMELAGKAKQLDPTYPDTWLFMASINHIRGDLDSALGHYETVLQYQPDHREARMLRTGILIDLRRDEEASNELEKMRENYPFDARLHYLHAVVLQRLNQPGAVLAALTDAKEIIEKIDRKALINNHQALLLAAMVNFSLRNEERTIDALTQLLRLNTGHAGARKLLASLLLNNNRNEQALDVLKPIIRLYPNDEQLLEMLGTVNMRLGFHQKASEYLEKALTLNSENVRAYTDLGLNRIAQGDESAGLLDLEKVIRVNPGNSSASIGLIANHMKNNQYDKAISVAQDYVKNNPENLTALNVLGYAQVFAGNYREARLNFEKAIDKNKSFHPARINLARLDAIEGKPGNARKQLASVIATEPKNTSALIELAKLEYSEKQLGETIRYLQLAYAIDPRSVPVVLHLAELYLATGAAKNAIHLTANAEAWAPRNPTLLDIQARAHIAVRDYDAARQLLQRMVKLTASDNQRLFQIARYQLKANGYEDAVSNLQNIIAKEPDHLKARILLCETLITQKAFGDAEQQIIELRDRHPKLAINDRLFGDLELKRLNYANALTHYRNALDKSPNSQLAIRYFQVHELAKRSEDGIEFLLEWIGKYPQDTIAQQAIAEAYFRSGNWNESIKHYEKILGNQPQNPLLLNNLALLYHKTQDSSALPTAKKAYSLAPENATVNDTIGWLLVDSGQIVDGLKYLRYASARKTNDPEIRFHIAVAQYRLGNHRQAKLQLEAALAHAPFDGSEHARDLLNRIP